MARPQSSWTLGLLIGIVALSAIGLAAFSLPATPDSWISLSAIGHILWLITFWRDRPERSYGWRFQARGFWVLSAVFTVSASFELVGLFWAGFQQQASLVTWFSLAIMFAAVGLITSLWFEPGDSTLASQLFFHGVMISPLVAPIVHLMTAASRPRGLAHESMLLLEKVGNILQVIEPLLILSLLGAFLLESARANQGRTFPWRMILANQAALMVLIARSPFP